MNQNNWREIQENLAPNQTFVDRPDIVARVFNPKLKALMKRLVEDNFFGKTKAHFYEFQKRGLPHAHILIILDNDNKKTDDNVDNFQMNTLIRAYLKTFRSFKYTRPVKLMRMRGSFAVSIGIHVRKGILRITKRKPLKIPKLDTAIIEDEMITEAFI